MKFKLLYKIFVPFLILLLIVLLSSAYLFNEFKDVIGTATTVEELSEKQKEFLFLRQEINELMMAANDIIITADIKYKSNYDRAFAEITKWFSNLDSSTINKAEKSTLRKIKFDVNKMDSLSAIIFSLSINNKASNTFKLMEELDYVHGESALSSINALFFSISQELKTKKIQVSNLREKLFFVIYMFSGFLILLIIAVGYFSVVKISNPIKSLAESANKIALRDYSPIPKINSKDEIGELYNAIQKMSKDIQAHEISIEHSKIFLENIIETIPSGLIVVKKNKRKLTLSEVVGTSEVILVNNSFCKMFETSKIEVIGNTIRKILTEINMPQSCKEHIIEGVIRESIQCDCYFPNRGRIVLDLNIAGFEMGEEHMLIVMHNITDLKKAEEIIKTEKEKAQKYLDIAGTIMIIISADQSISLINKKGQEILGYPENEIIGKNWFDNFIPEANRTEIKNVFKKLINGEVENVEYFENEIITKNGVRLIAWHNSLIKNEAGIITASLSSGEDITEKRKQELLLKKYNEELKEINSQKDKLFSIISHDLRSPFTGLLGYSDVLVEETEQIGNKDFHNYALIIKETANGIYTHLNNLLEWSRLQRDKIEVIIETINLSKAVNEVVKLLIGNAEKKNISVQYKIDELINVKADKNMLRSILQNIISNAIKFTHSGGKIEISSSAKNNFIEVTIADNGIGMDEAELKKIFRIDSQSRKGTANEKGTGLGLSITKDMIEKQFGTIEVRSKINEGTKFIFCLPT